MNIYKKISAAAVITAAAILSSCSDKGYWEQAPREQAYYFTTSSVDRTLEKGENTITLQIERIYTDNEESIEMVFVPDSLCVSPENLTVESPVTFKAGERTATVTVKITDALAPEVYSGELTFNANKSYSGVSAVAFDCPVAYTWHSIGTGGFFDGWVMSNVTEEYYPVEILKAEEGLPRYRVLNPYKEFYDSAAGKAFWTSVWGDGCIASTGPEYVEFWEVKDGSLLFRAYASGLLYQGTPGQSVNLYPWNYSEEIQGEPGNDGWLEPGLAVLSPIYYIPGLGGFGQLQYAVQIVVPEAAE